LCWVFFEIGSHKLFFQGGFEPWYSWSLPPEQLGLQTSVTSTQLYHVFWIDLSSHFTEPNLPLQILFHWTVHWITIDFVMKVEATIFAPAEDKN
jgi:hypothetical protein